MPILRDPTGTARQLACLMALPALMLFPTSGRAQSLQLLVPAYYYPAGSDLTYWNQLAHDATQAPINVIFNPATGPGTATDPNYLQAVTNLQAAGGRLFGYINTGYGTRSLIAMEQDVDAYRRLYPGLENGFFLDQMSNDVTPTHLDTYNSLYNYIKSQNSDLHVIGNPGTNTPEDYLTRPAADTLVTFENYASAYSATQPDPYTASLSNDQFANILHDEPSASAMLDDLQTAQARNVGYVYITDDALSSTHFNPFDRLPTYWNEEVAAVHAADVPEPAPCALLACLGMSGAGFCCIASAG